MRIIESPVRLLQPYPQDLPDLFYGEELVVFGRYSGEGRGTVVIEGERNGRRERFTAQAVFPETEDGNDFIPKLWASRRIGELTRQIRLEGQNASLVSQVRELGLRYGILTEYTSYLVEEPGMERPMLTGRGESDVRNQNGAGVERRVREDLARVAPASPAEQTGQRAFASADASAKLSASGSLAEANRAADRQIRDLSDSGSTIKRVGSKMFQLRNRVWTDVAHVDSLTVTEVAAYSDAYFALARAMPELARYLAVGDAVLIAGRQGSIKISPSGLQAWQPGQLQRVVRSYRGQ